MSKNCVEKHEGSQKDVGNVGGLPHGFFTAGPAPQLSTAAVTLMSGSDRISANG